MRGRNGLAPSGAAAAALIGALALACGSEPEPGGGAAPAAPSTAPAAVKPAEPVGPPAEAPSGGSDAERQAAQIFATRCAVCHGPDGRGDGPGSAALDPKPRNYHDATWQASVTDEHLAKIIVQGGSAVGRSPLMPPNPDLAGKPEVVAALVEHIRSLARQ
jgi:mono/diheme cytochrome c family protein